MGVLDSLSLVMVMFALALIGWTSELILYITHQTADGLSSNPALADMIHTIEWYVLFIHSNFFILIFSLGLTNFLLASRTTANPLYFGVFAMITFSLFWLLSNWIIPVMFQTLQGLDELLPYHSEWSALFKNNWYYLALSGVIGSALGYINGAKNTSSYYNYGGGFSWRKRKWF